ncbi:MAG: FxsB family cyclophane-forming radical SAM/SPASM peptide maturase [Pseudonocardiaceae bacterium]
MHALLADGWKPTPFREFVLKIHSRCNLACDYCYMYELADKTWRLRPRRMSRVIVEETATRIAEHIHTHGLTRITLILHGGEPLLAGPDLITHAVTSVRNAAGPWARVDVSLQTNGVGLDAGYLELFEELDIRVGVSVDGDASAHDRHRRYRNGRGSHAVVVAALERLTAEPYRQLFSGLLCTIDIRNDPVTTYEALLQFNPPMIDLLLPHGTWTIPPPERVPGSPSTPYADWLIAVFDRWFDAPRQETRIRLFEEIMHMLVGGASTTEAVGLSPVSAIVIETDGSVEQSDMLKSAYHGAPWTGLHVTRDPLDAALLLPTVVARQIGAMALATECRRCRIRQVCGGGLYPHRYRSGSGFANPSVYCPDLFRLITHIRQAMAAGITARMEKWR